MKSLLRLFRAVEVETDRRQLADKSILELTLKKGFIFSPEVFYHYSKQDLVNLANLIEKETGLTPEQLNASFHKSWQKIAEACIEQLVMEQLIHYMTTYDYEAAGIYDPESVYIPNEQLDIPEYVGGINVVVIHGYKPARIKEKVLSLLGSGIALKEDTIKDVLDVCKKVDLQQADLESIKNKEVKIALMDCFDLVPEDPVEFLRYLVFKATDKTLLIKDEPTITAIKESTGLNRINELFNKYEKEFGLETLAQIFLRFKPLFLAFKENKKNRPKINKIRKLATKYHKPLPKDFLNEITSMIKKGVKIDRGKLERGLEKVNIFRKVRLAYALKYRTHFVDSILYRIRNGKGFADKFEFREQIEANKILDQVLSSLVEDMRRKVDGKTILIPQNIEYALPATEKQFTGMFPSGTCVTIPKDMIVGINWHNVEDYRIDLDLSLINPETGKIGWDGSYRTGDRAILFSGDMTDAPGENGATELFYIKKQGKQEFIMLVNYYNYEENIEVPFKIVVAQEKAENFENNYMVDPNNVVSIANAKIDSSEKILGLLVISSEQCQFYFAETDLGRSISSSDNEFVEHSRKYLASFYQNTINLNILLEQAGAILTQEIDECDIDLSPEALEKDSITNLLSE